ncbi:hypothetical protein PX699_13955 [Sphingobium sp. H39-3-25]|uniref:hypothetical protein n=1 Tax=Sphingobium arseniciresistens TaxID=3030834 RepID=UPI0023B8E14E|nr:hypothetical protein [Sphingobium arseniciresistens]
MPTPSRLTAALPLAMTMLAMTACSSQPTAENSANITNMSVSNSANVTAIAEDSDALGAPDGPGSEPLPTDSWIGRWAGPEGLFLDIRTAGDGTPGHYALTIQDTLDRKADYVGTANENSITFRRDGKSFTIQPGSGADTGFKYLAEKEDCLIVQKGKEGYCR